MTDGRVPRALSGILGIILLATSLARADEPAPGDKAAGDATADLRPAFPADTERRYVVEQHTATTIGERTLSKAMRTDLSVEVRDDRKVWLTYRDVAVSVRRGEEVVRYDTRRPDSNENDARLGVLLELLKGKTLTAKYDAEGRVASITGLKKLQESPVGKVLAQFGNERVLRRDFSKLFTPTPGRVSAQKGDAWKVVEKTEVEPTLHVEVTQTLQLSDVTADRATIDIRGEARFVATGDRAGDGQPTPTIESQEIVGQLVWDTDEHRLISYETDYALIIALRAAAAEGEADRKIELRQKRKTALVE